MLHQVLQISYSLSLDSKLIIYWFPATWMQQQPSYNLHIRILCLTTHLPCAHWKGRSHSSRSPMSSRLWQRVSGSPNLMALWHAKLLRMARRVGGTICAGWPASVHYGYTVRCNVTVYIYQYINTAAMYVYVRTYGCLVCTDSLVCAE